MSEELELHKFVADLAKKSLALKKIHYELYDLLETHAEEVAEGKIPDKDLVDVYIVCREIFRHSEEIRKEARRMRTNASTVFGKRVMQKILQDLQSGKTNSGRVQGKLGSAEPDVRKTMVTPKKDSPEYKEMMAELDIPAQVIERGLINPSFSGLQTQLTQLQSEGKKLPDFAKYTFTEYDMSASSKTSLVDKIF